MTKRSSPIHHIPDDFEAALEAEDDKRARRILARLGSAELMTEAALDAAIAGRFGVVLAAVDAGANPNGVDEEGASLLAILASAGDAKAAERLIAKGAVVDDAALEQAIESGSLATVAACVAALGHAHAVVTGAAAAAKAAGREWVLPALAGERVRDAQSYTLNDVDRVAVAVDDRNRARVDAAVARVGINAIGRFGYTPLIYAIESDEDLALEWLRTQSIDLRHKDAEGATYLMHAVALMRTKVVAELIALGVDIQEENSYGMTALDLAISSPPPECFALAKTLLGAGARYGSKSRDQDCQGRIPTRVYQGALSEGRLPPELREEAGL